MDSEVCLQLDAEFGPQIESSCRSFDFTLLFEESLLSVPVSGLFTLAALARLTCLFYKPSNVYHTKYAVLIKQLLITTLLALDLAQIVLTSLNSAAPRTSATLPAAALRVLATLLLFALSFFEHLKSPVPSDLICIYLFARLILDLPLIRTTWLLGRTAIASLRIAQEISSLILLIAESWAKTALDSHTLQSPDGNANIFSRPLLAWLIPLFIKGYSQPLIIEDLYPLNKSLSTNDIGLHLTSVWWKNGFPRWGKYGLGKCLGKALYISLLAPVLPRLLQIGFTFCQPFLIQATTVFLDSADSGSSLNYGYGLIGAYFLVYTGVAISNSWYWYNQTKFQTQLRGGLISLLYQKTLRKDVSGISEAEANTLMSADVDKVIIGMKNFHELWASTVELAIGFWLLYRQIRLAMLALCVLSIACSMGGVKIARFAAPRQTAWMASLQVRITQTTKMLNSLRGIKLLGLESKLAEKTSALRRAEVDACVHSRVATTAAVVLSFSNMLLAPILVFSVFLPISRGDHPAFSTQRIFNTLTLVSLMTEPFITVLQSLPHFSMVLSCLGRIEVYMLGPEHCDSRDIRNSSTSRSSAESGGQPSPEIKELQTALTLKECDFSWRADLPLALTDINLEVPTGQLTVIMGPVACGKTTLLHAILGELFCARGKVTVTSKIISYCSQKPWITNTTIKQAIIGQGTQDKDWYDKVVAACALKRDFANFPLGDETETGSGGVTLSGGQKQRVSLARALYHRSSLILLDDVFSGLDQATQSHIANSLFDVEGLLHPSKSEATTVLATHSSRFLKYASHAVVLSSDGRIHSQGPPCNLKPDEIAMANVKEHEMKGIIEAENAHQKSQGQPNFTPGQGASPSSETTGSDKAALRTYLGTMGSLNSTLFLFMGVVYVSLYKVPDYWASTWGEFTDTHPNQPRDSFYLGIYALFYVLALIVCALWFSHLLLIIIPRTGIEVHSRLLQTLMKAKHSFLTRTDVGSIATRFGQDVTLVDTELPMAMMNTYIESLTILAQLALVASASVYLLAAFPLLAGAIYLIQRIYLRTSKRLRHLELETKGPIFSHFDDTVRGLTSIRAFGWQDSLVHSNNGLLDTYQRPYYLLASAQVWLELVLNLLVAGLATVTLGVATATRNGNGGAQTAVALLNLVTMGKHLKSLIMFWTMLEICLAAITRVTDFVKSTPQEATYYVEESDSDDEKNVTNVSRGSASIELAGVSARYTDDGVDVVADLSLRIDAGMKVAVCGRTGSGKSSLINIVLKMMDISKGELRIFGIPSTQLDPQRLRRMINTIPQDPYFFDGSVRENLDPESRSSDKEINEALQHVGLVAKLPSKNHLDENLRLESYSAGEQQLLSLARAMLRPKDILILDEATSNVDEETHKRMHAIIAEHFSASTIIAVTHRLDQLDIYDAVLVMERGRLLRWSTPSQRTSIEID